MGEEKRVKPQRPQLIKTKVEPNKPQGIEIPRDPVEFEKVFGFNPTEANVLICTPAYGGLVYVNFMHSIFQMFNLFNYSGIKYGFKTITNESLITRARMTCISYFLSHPEYTHILFIDADVSFRPDTAIKLLAANKDVISAVYPKKGYEWNRLPELIKRSIQGGKLNLDSFKNIQSQLLSYVVNFSDTKLKVEKGCIKVKDAPTGFMLIKKSTIETLIEKNPDMGYISDLGLDENDHKPGTFWLFFDCMRDPVDKRYLSEDYAFCRLVQLAGLETWIEVTSPLTHTGTTSFEGNVWDMFEVEK